jgi:hypothetical protein
MLIVLSMRGTLRSIIFLLTLALLVQNTCPHGFAGKTSVARTCANCPMKHHFTAPPEAQGKVLSGASSVHFPLYVLEAPKMIFTFRLYPIKSARPVLANGYTDVLPDELLRPPRA